MQKITVVGNLGRDPEERTTPSGLKLITFSLAVQAGKDKTMWYDVNIWDEKIAMFSGILSHMKKGSRILLIGDLSMPETYQSKDGSTKVKCKIQPCSMNFLPSGERKAEEPLSHRTKDQYQQSSLSDEWNSSNITPPPF